MMLPAESVRKARKYELGYLQKLPVYPKVPPHLAKGNGKIGTIRCDVNKGDALQPEVRSRLVGKEFNWKGPLMEGAFAATPPVEALKVMCSWLMTRRRKNGEPISPNMMVLDVSRAHFHPPAVRCRKKTTRMAW